MRAPRSAVDGRGRGCVLFCLRTRVRGWRWRWLSCVERWQRVGSQGPTKPLRRLPHLAPVLTRESLSSMGVKDSEIMAVMYILSHMASGPQDAACTQIFRRLKHASGTWTAGLALRGSQALAGSDWKSGLCLFRQR